MADSGDRPVLSTQRLSLWGLHSGDIQALIEGSPDPVEGAIDAVFPRPFQVPPLMGDALELIRDQIQRDPAVLLNRAWFFADHQRHAVVGAGGFFGPDEDGAVIAGYAIYPEFQGQGYATEAMTALLEMAWTFPGVRAVRATIPPTNTPSVRVAERIGLVHVGEGIDPEVGEIRVYELTRV